MSENNSKANLHVGNLPFTATEDDVRELFSTYGEIKSLKLITDRETGRSRGFGFVEFESADHAAKAVDELNGKELGFGSDQERDRKRAITVKVALPREERPRREFGGGRREGGFNNNGGERRRGGFGDRDNKRSYEDRDNRWR